MAKRFFFVWLCLSTTVVLAASRTGIAIYDFSATGHWTSARVTNLKAVPSPIIVAQPGGALRNHRYALDENHLLVGMDFRLDEEKWRETNLYQELQAFSLKEMLRRGYISKTLFDDVSFASTIWKPSQVRFAVDWIEMPLAEALVLYQGNIPWDRVLGGPERNFLKDQELWAAVPPQPWIAAWPQKTPIRLVRTSLMVGLGQERDLHSGELRPLRLSWEHYPSAHPQAMPGRGVSPFMAEFSRALAGDGVTGGSLIEPLRVLLSILEAEARIARVKPQDYLLFAHALDRTHARLFQQSFRMRPFTAAAREAVLVNRFDFEKLADGRSEDERSVRLTTLSEAAGKVASTVLLSEWHESRVNLCGGVRERTHEFQRAFFEGIFHHFVFPGAGPEPVCVQDFSPVLMLPVFEKFVSWPLTSDKATALMQTMQDLDWDPNFMAPFWRGSPFIFYPEVLPVSGTRPLGAVRIDNLSTKMALSNPAYLKNVLVRIYEAQFNRIARASKQAASIFINYMITAAEQMAPVAGMTQPVISESPSIEAILDHVIYMVSTTDSTVRDQLVALGGRGAETVGYGVPKIERRDGKWFVIEGLQTKAYLVIFRAKEIRALVATTPRMESTCPTLLVDYFLLQAAAQL